MRSLLFLFCLFTRHTSSTGYVFERRHDDWRAPSGRCSSVRLFGSVHNAVRRWRSQTRRGSFVNHSRVRRHDGGARCSFFGHCTSLDWPRVHRRVGQLSDSGIGSTATQRPISSALLISRIVSSIRFAAARMPPPLFRLILPEPPSACRPLLPFSPPALQLYADSSFTTDDDPSPACA